MQTHLADFIKDTPSGQIAESILRKCVHCGFCTATCPTYQLLGDELDGPRGRIYLMKQVLEGMPATSLTQTHLDRCLTCRSCETTCPSGVEYGRLIDIGRTIVNQQVPRAYFARLQRWALTTILPNPKLFNPLLALGHLLRSIIPKVFDDLIPAPPPPSRDWPTTTHQRRLLMLEGCVQPSLSPATQVAASRVLDRLGYQVIRTPQAGCCGAVALHLDHHSSAQAAARRNIDAWWPHIQEGVIAISWTASGCGVMVSDYAQLLADDPQYATKAAQVSALACDISKLIENEKDKLNQLLKINRPQGLWAFHPPCTLQHGLKHKGQVELLLSTLGFQLTPVANSHLCCGSAGTYSILQPDIAETLKTNKIAALTAGQPNQIITANIGCQMHLQSATNLPVRHWIEAIDDCLSATSSKASQP